MLTLGKKLETASATYTQLLGAQGCEKHNKVPFCKILEAVPPS